MVPYLAFVWNSFDSRKTEACQALIQRLHTKEPRWQTSIRQKGLVILYRELHGIDLDHVYVMSNQRGVVIGRIFDRSYAERDDSHESPPQPVTLDEIRSAQIVASAGQELIDRYWGRYIAFIYDMGSRKTWVLRDPGGDVPCHRAEISGIDVYFQRLEDYEQLDPPPLSINRHYLLGFLMFDSACVRETGLNEVETILPGERVEHNQSDRRRMFCWNPLKIANRDCIEYPVDAEKMLRTAVRASIHAWASCFDGIMLHLSGGLDSSIVASCLSNAPTRPEILCRNLYSLDPGSDERRYARAVAERAGLRLIEQPATFAFEFSPIQNFPSVLTPFTWCTYDHAGSVKEFEFLSSLGISAIFTGDGGDELFVTSTPLPGSIDYFIRHGINHRFFASVLDDAIADRASAWRVVRAVYRYGLRKQPWHMRSLFSSDVRSLVRSEVVEEALNDTSLWHPLYRQIDDLRQIPPGKFVHAYLLSASTNRFHIPSLFDSSLVYLAVLRSQPILELSLRTPLYVLRSKGLDRFIARRAFAADVPTEIITRDTKATGTVQLQEIFAANRKIVRESLLDGFLVREGFLDRNKLEAVLSEHSIQSPAGIVEISTYFDVETWVRSRSETRKKIAA